MSYLTIGAKEFLNWWNDLAEQVHETAVEHGWWTNPDTNEYDVDCFNKSEKIALMHSELSEALEAMRMPEWEMSEKIPVFFHLEEELADLQIRLMDFAAAYGLRVAEATIAKAEYNKSRPYKHGGKKF